MESQVLSIALKGRGDFDLLANHLNPKRWSREFQIVFGFISEYYKRDSDAKSVDIAILGGQIEHSVQNEKHVDKFMEIVREADAMETSSANVKVAVLKAKEEELAQELALRIANGKEHRDILDQYNQLLQAEDLDVEEDSGIQIYTAADMEALLMEEIDPTSRLPVFPRDLGDRMGGGMRGSDKMTLIARPNMGKTGAILTMACGWARAGFPGTIFNNEERIARLYIRAISCITGLTGDEVKADLRKAMGMAMDRGFGNLKFVSMSPGNPAQIDRELDKNPDDKWFIVDQLRNLAVKSDNKVNQLEDAAKAIRNIGKARNLVSVDVTQAGDSASGKSVLDMGDVDNSNTGIPGACDILLGIGANEMQVAQGIRVFSLIKNKLGAEEAFPTRFNQSISKYVSER